MNHSSGRYIHSRLSSKQIPDLLEAIFVGEMISPSSCLWIVSPWISDIPIIDNTTNSFQYLNMTWEPGKIKFSRVLRTLAELGTTIHVATRPLQHNRAFVGRLLEVPTISYIKTHLVEDLHEKGILGDSFYLGGSMNFTYNGMSINEEAVIYKTDPEVVAARRVIYRDRWGGELA